MEENKIELSGIFSEGYGIVPKKLMKMIIGNIIVQTESGSTLIAAERTGRRGFGFEIKKEFYEKANEWLEKEQSQLKLFDIPKKQKHYQKELFISEESTCKAV